MVRGEERPRPAPCSAPASAAPPLGSGRVAWESSRIFLFTRPQWPPPVLPLVAAPQGAGEEEIVAAGVSRGTGGLQGQILCS